MFCLCRERSVSINATMQVTIGLIALNDRLINTFRCYTFSPNTCIHMADGESIYGWIEKRGEERARPPRYRSKHNPKLPPTGSTFVLPNSTKLPGANLGDDSTSAIMCRRARQPAATMGRSSRDVRPDPHCFIRGGTRQPRACDLTREPRTCS